MRKSVLALALMLGVVGGAGSLVASERGDALASRSQVVAPMVMASLADQDQSVVTDQNTVDKKAKKKKAKKKKVKKGATDTGAGAGGQWDSGTPQ
ncbi:MAG: hypothetical protein HQM02_13660 [Magnetococcales bacterium]|nr:hypothetical protein [Magnetococcales bacterium]